MYGVCLDIRPTSALTFRRLPSAISHISTYPFVPPSTLSGWLRRLFMLREGVYPETAVKKPNFYAMPRAYQVLGAYPVDGRNQFHIHRTRRHGPMYQSKHVVFSRLYRNKGDEGNNEKLQLHTWEYLMVNRLRGYVLHPDKNALKALSGLINLGCKLGKEGYAYLESVSPVLPLKREQLTAIPDTLVPGTALMLTPGDLYAVYQYEFGKEDDQFDLATESPSSITGFRPLWAGYPEAELEADYWVYDSEEITAHLPVSLGEVLYG